MSVNIVLKDNDRVYLAVDSQSTASGSKYIQSNKNNIKLWKVNGGKSCYMSHCGRLRDACIVRTMNNLIKKEDVLDMTYVVKVIKHKIVQALLDAEFIDVSNDYIEKISSSFFIVNRDKAFSIETDLSVIEIEDYAAHGAGKYMATGSLASTVGEPAMDRIKKALKASCNNIYVDFPVYVVDTKTNEIKTIKEEDL